MTDPARAGGGGAAPAAAMEERVRRDGLLRAGRRVVVALSGGRDSVCLLDLAVRICGADAVTALHVDHGLRDDAAADEAHCRELCERLGAGLEISRLGAPEGNVQAWGRAQRYAAAGRLGERLDADVATGHTATDQVETVLYRLAASPGRRALLGMSPRDGRLVRPLLAFRREETGAYCESRGLAWRDDPSNRDPAFARSRVRHGLLAALCEIHPAAVDNVLRTLEVLRDEAAVLDGVVVEELQAAGWRGAGTPVRVERLAALAPALRRLAVQALADAAAGDRSPPVGPRAEELLGLASRGGTASIDLGAGLRAVVSYGELRMERASRGSSPDTAGGEARASLAHAGALAWNGGELRWERGEDLPVGDGTFDADALGDIVEIRAWRPGDRMRPIGLGGSRSLQDLFTDRKVARDRRRRLPVLVARGEIAWVPGVAGGERFKVTPRTRRRVRFAWREG